MQIAQFPKIRSLGMILAFSAAGLACASAQKPTEELSQSEGALRSAQELGAGQIPAAALEVKLAQEELDKARELMKDDKNDLARQSLLRSRADAELALAMTKQGQARTAEQRAQDELHAAQKSVQ